MLPTLPHLPTVQRSSSVGFEILCSDPCALPLLVLVTAYPFGANSLPAQGYLSQVDVRPFVVRVVI